MKTAETEKAGGQKWERWKREKPRKNEIYAHFPAFRRGFLLFVDDLGECLKKKAAFLAKRERKQKKKRKRKSGRRRHGKKEGKDEKERKRVREKECCALR